MKTQTPKFIILLICFFAFNSNANAQTYDPYAVQVINNLIVNNGLQATPNAPETWEFATWNDATPKKIVELMLTNRSMWRNLSFRGLVTLKKLYCNWTNDNNGCIDEIDVSNCTQLEIIDCSLLGSVSKLTLTNCFQLQTLSCFGNRLTKLNLTNLHQLKTLVCSHNHLTNLDLTGLNNLVVFDGNRQSAFLTLFENQIGEFTLDISFNNPTFSNNAISYFDGILKSNDNNVQSTSFEVEAIRSNNSMKHLMNGILYFTYSEEVENNPQLKIYPIPAYNQLFLECRESQQITIKLYNMLGMEVLEHNAVGSSVVNVNHLEKGVYVAKVFLENKFIRNKKIIKQ